MSVRYWISAAVAAIAPLAMLAVATPAQAAPPSSACTQYAFNGEFRVQGYPSGWSPTEWEVTFSSTGQFPSGPARVKFADGGFVDGTVTGGAISGRQVEFTIKWKDKPNNYWRFLGFVGDDGLVYRGDERRQTEGGYEALWYSERPLDCIASTAPEPGTTLDPDAPISPADVPR
ncbi:hypothetical protein [Antrihabitans sp. YC2-6]|uniref:hypothetical protein n=1 Tax=Antrihabitans sp. YC2-6 TaxID=2799498 RepID=UPI0018F4ECED|nr:hypothetical protein [Antrihabitans sp. YC2-6]MBJ8343729.1 hypothetical protein [Antrihabitans sp. YC2-6]